MQSVAYQQLNGTAAETILGRVKALYPHRRFPTPEDLLATPDDLLRGAGLSRAKVAAIKDIARNTISGVIPSSRAIAKMTEAEIVERVAQGQTNAEIAAQLVLSVRTVERHLLNAYTKLGVRGRTEAISQWHGHRDLFPHQPHRTRLNRRRRRLTDALTLIRQNRWRV